MRCARIATAVHQLPARPITVFRIIRTGRKLNAGIVLLCVLCNPWICLASHPNVVIFVIDDPGAQDLTCYGNGLIDTPNIDQLSAEGMRWTYAYSACPVCSPTRIASLSGQGKSRRRRVSRATSRNRDRLLLDLVENKNAVENDGVLSIPT